MRRAEGTGLKRATEAGGKRVTEAGGQRVGEAGVKWVSQAGGQRAAAARAKRAGDRGQVAVEYLGFLPVLLLVALAGIQLGLAAYAAQQAGTGARAAARTATHDEATTDPAAAGAAAMSGWIAARSDVSVSDAGDEAVARVTVQIPSVVPFWNFDPVTRTATLPLPEEDES